MRPRRLFGSQAKFDSPKFHEACTVFAVAALAEGNTHYVEKFLDGLRLPACV